MEISDAAGDLVDTRGYFGDGVSYQTQELRPQGKLYLHIYCMISFNLTVFNQQVCKTGHLYPANAVMVLHIKGPSADEVFAGFIS